jgi:hypothetical protein
MLLKTASCRKTLCICVLYFVYGGHTVLIQASIIYNNLMCDAVLSLKGRPFKNERLHLARSPQAVCLLSAALGRELILCVLRWLLVFLLIVVLFVWGSTSIVHFRAPKF